MTETPLETTTLANGLTLRLYNASRKIADKGEFQSDLGPEAQRRLEGDIWLVALAARMDIPVSTGRFPEDSSSQLTHQAVVQALGDPVPYEKLMERHLVHSSEKDLVFNQLLEEFQTRLAPYLAHPEFGKRYLLKRFSEETSPQAMYAKGLV